MKRKIGTTESERIAILEIEKAFKEMKYVDKEFDISSKVLGLKTEENTRNDILELKKLVKNESDIREKQKKLDEVF